MYFMKILIIHWIQIKIVHAYGPSYIVGFAFYFNSSKWTRSFKKSSTRYLVYFYLNWPRIVVSKILSPCPPFPLPLIHQKTPPHTYKSITNLVTPTNKCTMYLNKPSVTLSLSTWEIWRPSAVYMYMYMYL